MAHSTPSPQPARREVTIAMDHAQSTQQPSTFNLCPLGVQFYAPQPMEEFKLVELEVDVTDPQGAPRKVTCKGAVVRCQREPEPDRYRIWVKFFELPEGTRDSIRCTAKAGKLLCDYCENF
jgi:hypothetical protein